MGYLAYYSNERTVYKEFWDYKLTASEAEIVIRKLYRHYKLGEPNIIWTSGNRHSSCGGKTIRINTDWGLNIGCISHEVAHAIQVKKGRHIFENGGLVKTLRWHSKKHNVIQKRIMNYCKKKDYWKTEIEIRLAPKPEKPKSPEPTKQEIKQNEIVRIINSMEWYQKTIKIYQKRVKKLQGTINRKQVWLEKSQKQQHQQQSASN